MRKKKKWLVFFILFFITVIILCVYSIINILKIQQKTNVKPTGRLTVSASIYPVYFFASEIAGEKISVYNITPAGVEPHDFEPTSKEMVNITASKLLILNGGIEPWGTKLQDTLQNQGIPIITAGKGLINKSDPHIWLNPQLAEVMVTRIENGMESIDQPNINYYKANAKKLEEQLAELDRKYSNGLKSCQSKYLITSHSAFGYLAAQYGLTQIPIAGLSPDSEPSTKQLADITKFAKDNNVSYIFYEPLASQKLAQTIANEIGIKTLPLDPLEGLSNNKIAQGENYFSVMEQNLKNLQLALKCTNL